MGFWAGERKAALNQWWEGLKMYVTVLAFWQGWRLGTDLGKAWWDQKVGVWLVMTALATEVEYSMDREELESKCVGYGCCYQRQLWLILDWRGMWPDCSFKTVSLEECCSRWIRWGAVVEARGYCCNLGSSLIFLEPLLSSKHCSRHWGYSRDKPETDF